MATGSLQFHHIEATTVQAGPLCRPFSGFCLLLARIWLIPRTPSRRLLTMPRPCLISGNTRQSKAAKGLVANPSEMGRPRLVAKNITLSAVSSKPGWHARHRLPHANNRLWQVWNWFLGAQLRPPGPYASRHIPRCHHQQRKPTTQTKCGQRKVSQVIRRAAAARPDDTDGVASSSANQASLGASWLGLPTSASSCGYSNDTNRGTAAFERLSSPAIRAFCDRNSHK